MTGKFLRSEPKEAFKQKIRPDSFLHLIDGYEKVYPNLPLHAQDWPAPDALRLNGGSGSADFHFFSYSDHKWSINTPEASKFIEKLRSPRHYSHSGPDYLRTEPPSPRRSSAT